MIKDTSSTRCGWYKFPYFGKPDSAGVKFMNSLDSSYFSALGLANGAYIDLSTVFNTSDTAWILADPFPTGPAAVYSSFPGQTTPCEREVFLKTTMRDYDSTHPDFGGFNGGDKNGAKTECWIQGEWNAPIPGMMLPQLSAGKPVPSPTTPCPIDSFNWFTTEMIGQYSNAMCYDLKLVKNDDGLYQYDDQTFFPSDSFRYLDPNHAIPNPRYDIGQEDNRHNFYFTMELNADFQYRKGQTFYFRGDDDVWVFINNRLVVDLGGIHKPMVGLVRLDTLGLTIGNTYKFNLFFCERNMPGSSFRMVTSIKLQTSTSLLVIVRDSLPNFTVFDIKQKITKTGLACDDNGMVIDTQPAIMDFKLTGPQFSTTPYQLTAVNSPHFGGITIRGDSTVILDTTAITGLVAGSYLITCYLRSDRSQVYTIPFTVAKLPAHHLDILVPTMPLDMKKDATVDSIVIGMIETNAEAYAVLRDSNQVFCDYATNAQWTIRDPTVATVEKVAGTHRCVLTKVNAGQAWLVVTQGTLKPDSTLVITYVLPQHPVIISGVMLDNNADLIPDTLILTLSDTFKTDQRLDSVVIAYRGLLIPVPGSEVTIQGTQLRVPVPESVGIDGRPTGTATIFMTVDGEGKSHSRAFTDGVCPAIIAADVLENDGTNPDVLFLTFSEPITTACCGRIRSR